MATGPILAMVEPAPDTPGQARERLGALGLALRAEKDKDGSFLLDLYRSVRAEELAPVPWSAAMKDAFLADQLALQRADWGRRFGAADRWVVEQHGRPIGRLYLDRSAPTWRVIDIGLMTEARGRGCGQALLRWCQADAVQAGAKTIDLLVLVHNRAAERLYLRLGFIPDRAPTGPYQAMTWTAPGAHAAP